MSWLDKLFGAGYKTIQIGGVALPQQPTVNIVSGASGVNNALLGRTDLTIASGSQLAQVTPTAGAVTVLAGQAAWIDASAGTVTVTPPAVAVAAMFGVVDSKLPSGSFSAAHYASITNAGLNIEDPGAPGVLSNNPVKLQTPTMSVVWQADPTGSYFKVFGG